MHPAAAAAQKNAPAALLLASSLLVGGLLNSHPPGARDTVAPGVDFECPPSANAASSPSAVAAEGGSRGLLPEPAVAFLAVVFPLLPVLAPSVISSGTGGRKLLAHLEQGDTWKLVVCHALGQSGSFSTAELARFFIVKPNAQFFSDCNLSPEECGRLAAESTGSGERVQKRQIVSDRDRDDGPALCRNTTATYTELRRNLHGFPDVSSALVGASVASFFLSAAARRRNKRTAEENAAASRRETADPSGEQSPNSARWEAAQPYVRFVVALSCLAAVALLLADRYAQCKSRPAEMMFALVAGASFQLGVHFFFAAEDVPRSSR